MQFLTILKTIITLLPLVIQAISAVEEAFPGTKVGSAKLDTVKSVIQASYTTAKDVEIGFEDLWPALSSVIASIVKNFNLAGIFKKPTPIE
jgi:hypothetical protein